MLKPRLVRQFSDLDAIDVRLRDVIALEQEEIEFAPTRIAPPGFGDNRRLEHRAGGDETNRVMFNRDGRCEFGISGCRLTPLTTGAKRGRIAASLRR